MALEDAWLLAAELDRTDDVAAGLAAYSRRRRPRAERVQRAARLSGHLYHLGPGLRRVADLGLGIAASAAPGLIERRFDWLFGADVTSA
ncbi:MAG TPA: monooxygenase, partial [Amaricoccus sp.]|nr:monooxygenase [Amaricoccus sp.]